jgi:murein DD-endopeptidase MepM/ murein hydrolase activator NlpD
MSYVVKGTRGTGRLRAAVNLTLGCVLLGGCSTGSDRFSSVSFGSGYGEQPRAAQAAAPSTRVADNSRPQAQARPSYYQAQPASYRQQAPAQPAGGYQLASATPSQTGGYLQASRVDLPPLQQRQPAQGTKMADGYGPYNQPPLPDGSYSGPRAVTPYDAPRGDLPQPGIYTPQGGDYRDYRRDAPSPPPPSDFYRRSDAAPAPSYPPRDETRVYEPAPERPYAGEPAYNGDGRSAYGRTPEGDGYGTRRPWSGRTDGEMVAVAPGDTLPALARRYGVTVDMIARANGLSTVYVRPGTKLFIPRADPASYAQGSSRSPAKAAQAAPAPAGKDQSRPAVASLAEKQNRNAGQALKASPAGTAQLVDKTPQSGSQQAPAAVQAAPIKSAGLAPSIEATCEAALSNPQPRMGATFRKPVDGKTISPFGPQKDGTVNEGITISVPKGTPVKAAENGVVAYVGDELPGFGNLILIRHADEYVTAYAHADAVMVKKCDVVKRGQTVATAGTTGDTSQPQVHFEIRKNSKPVDPSPLLGS